MEGVSARGRTQSWPVLQQDSSGQEMAERLCPSAFNRVERAMIEGAERRQRTLTGFLEASHVLSKLPFRTTPRCPVVLPRDDPDWQTPRAETARGNGAFGVSRRPIWTPDQLQNQ